MSQNTTDRKMRCAICGEEMNDKFIRKHYCPPAVHKWLPECLDKEEAAEVRQMVYSRDNIIFVHEECAGKMKDGVTEINALFLPGFSKAKLHAVWEKMQPYAKMCGDLRKRMYEKQNHRCYQCGCKIEESSSVIRRIDIKLGRIEENGCLVCSCCNKHYEDFVETKMKKQQESLESTALEESKTAEINETVETKETVEIIETEEETGAIEETEITEVTKTEKASSAAGWKSVLKWILGYAALAAAILVLFNTVFMLNLIPSGSMEKTIQTGDVVFANRLERKTPERYDIMVFCAPDEPETYFIKRVIGLPGEIITIADGKVYADGVELDDSFIAEKMNHAGYGTYEVPEGCYFMLGDNRNHSLDSRFWDNKYVPEEEMVAKAKTIIFSFKKVGSLKYTAAKAEAYDGK